VIVEAYFGERIMSYQTPNSEIAKWTEIRDRAFHVVLLTCREDGFWALPTVRSEVRDTYSVPGAPEDNIRKSDKFGSPSITVSFNALTALASVLGAIPRLTADQTLAQIDTHRGRHGGYGSLTQRMNQWEVNAVPRHTAMAVIAHLEFGSGDAPDSLRKHLAPSISWLLSNQSKSGGWPYDWTNPPHALGFLSTASAICALKMYLSLLGDGDRQFTKLIPKAISKALVALATEQKDGVWSGDGSPLDKQVRDTAFALRLLQKVNREGQLDRLTPASSNLVGTMVERFAGGALNDGWPKRAGENVSNVAGSVSALAVILDAGDSAGIPPEKLRLVDATILKSWKTGDAPQHLAAWDWQCLAILASRVSGPITGSQATVIENSCQTLRAKLLIRKLKQNDLKKIDGSIRETVTFALTAGTGFQSVPIHQQFLSSLRWIAQKVSEKLLVQGVIALLGLILAALIFGADPIDYVKALIERVHR
jgi:hypothetical protein